MQYTLNYYGAETVVNLCKYEHQQPEAKLGTRSSLLSDALFDKTG